MTAYPLPRIYNSLHFSTLDLLSGYWQVLSSKDAQEEVAFRTCRDMWNWKVLLFGLTSALETFEYHVGRVSKGLQWKTVLLHLDDLTIFSADFRSYVACLEEVLLRFRFAGLKLTPSNSEVFQREVHCLSHVAGVLRVSTDAATCKVASVPEWARPFNIRDVEAFLGFSVII